MTLHWWMHWFWVTLLITLACSGRTLCAPQSEELQHITETGTLPVERQARAMYFSKPVSTTNKPPNKPFIINITDPDDVLVLPKSLIPELSSNTDQQKVLSMNAPLKLTLPLTNTSQDNTNTPEIVKLVEDVTKPNDNNNNTFNNETVVHPAIQWTPVNYSIPTTTTETPETTVAVQATMTEKATNMTVTKATNMTDAVSNVTESNTTVGSKKRNSTRPDLVKDDVSVEGLSESRIVTEKPLSLETSYLQTRAQQPSDPNIESYRRVVDTGLSGMDTGAIAGISFAALVLAALAGSTAFVLYRRRYLNKPQALNDKSSNPDSSGYLDDSTIRDNSEEMYSLDNDSFLNSLEAMTIQNYWTDTVKHTKL